MQAGDLGRHLKQLREDRKVSLRQLSRLASMSPASLSAIEKGTSSPTLATLSRILAALGLGFADFFAHEGSGDEVPVFYARDMRTVRDAHRNYTLVLPKRSDVKFEMVREVISPETKSQWETHRVDIGGLILEGGPARLEAFGKGQWQLKAGDAFYIPAGLKHRMTNTGKRQLVQVTVAYPPRY